jgi:hypothetical protein
MRDKKRALVCVRIRISRSNCKAGQKENNERESNCTSGGNCIYLLEYSRFRPRGRYFEACQATSTHFALPAAINIGPCPATPAYPPTTCPRSGPSWDLMHVSRGPSSTCFAFGSLRLGRAAPRQPALRPLCCGLAGARPLALSRPAIDRDLYTRLILFYGPVPVHPSVTWQFSLAAACFFFLLFL